jgi:hypothetical protein
MKDFIVYINEKLKITKKMFTPVYTKDDFENIKYFNDVYEKYFKDEQVTLTFGDVFSGPNEKMSKFLCCYCLIDYDKYEKHLFIIVNDNILEGVLTKSEYVKEKDIYESGFCKVPKWLEKIIHEKFVYSNYSTFITTFEDFLDNSSIITFYDDLKIPLTNTGKKLLNK